MAGLATVGHFRFLAQALMTGADQRFCQRGEGNTLANVYTFTSQENGVTVEQR